MNNLLLDNDSAVAEEMDSLMLHSDVGGEFEESTEALLNSILRVDVVQLEQDDDFSEELTSPYIASATNYTKTKTLKKSRKCCSLLRTSGKDKRNRKCTCDVCTTANAVPRNNAEKSQNGERQFECNVCDRSFMQLSVLEIHKKQHRQQSCVCDVCSETFPNQDALQTHQEQHAHKTEYKCNMCIASFATRRRLSTHKRVHVQERPFPCDFCGACFLRKSSLSAHLRAKPLGQPVHKQAGDLACEGCNLAFISFCGKLKHCQVLHPDSVVISENNREQSGVLQDTKSSKSLSLAVGVKSEEAYDHHISRDAQSLRDVEILFSDMGNLINVTPDTDEDVQEEENKNMEEDLDALPSVIVAYSGDENDCGDDLNYELVSQADAFAACSFLEADSFDEIDAAENEEGASR